MTEVATDLNVGHLMLLLQFGSMGKELAAYNTKLFADRVMPRLKGLFSEWEDRWWPQPMPRPERAEVAPFRRRWRRNRPIVHAADQDVRQCLGTPCSVGSSLGPSYGTPSSGSLLTLVMPSATG